MSPRAIGYQPRAIRWGGIRSQEWEVPGIAGMYDSKAHASEAPGDVPLLINGLPVDTERGGQVAMRTGLRRLNPSAGTTVQLGNAGASGRKVQGIFEDPETNQALIWVGGECWSLTMTGSTSTLVISVASLAAAAGGAITMTVGLPVFGVFFNGKWIFKQDSFNAFSWDGTTLGGITKLTNTPITTHNGPTVYYAKLFFLKTDRKTIVWSEENQENTGYEAGGFNNAWQLTQSAQGDIINIHGANEGLYIVRVGSVGIIRGAVTTTFSTDGVRDSVSSSSGGSVGVSQSEYCSAYLADALWWFDGNKRLYCFRPGSGLVPIWRQLPRMFSTATQISNKDAEDLWLAGEEALFRVTWRHWTFDPSNYHVYLHGTNNGGRRVGLVFDGATLKPLAWFIYPPVNQPGSVPQFTNIITVTFGQAVEVYVDENGYVFGRWFDAPSQPNERFAQYWDETESTTGTRVSMTVLGPMHGWSAGIEWHFDQLDVVLDRQSDTNLTAGYLTSRLPRLTSVTPQVLDPSGTGTLAPHEMRVAAGINAGGRWARVYVKLTAGNQNDDYRPALHGWRLVGYPVAGGPKVS